ncbi:hypothetical protein Syun_012125 [Stephania yunnanensis]|uniref:Uncharacterized protein n=1 Tax=Stephania yunnanensis TaxID=152371 RepID=A0AAP0K155_9MAGN
MGGVSCCDSFAQKTPKIQNGAVLVAPMCKLLRENKRMIDRSIREIERERQGLQTQEKKVIAEIKKSAKQGQMWKLKKEFLLDGGYACSLKCYHVLVMPFCNAYGVGLTDFLLVILANNGGALAGLAACVVTMDIIATVASTLCGTSRQVPLDSSFSNVHVCEASYRTAMGRVISSCVCWIFIKAFKGIGEIGFEYPGSLCACFTQHSDISEGGAHGPAIASGMIRSTLEFVSLDRNFMRMGGRNPAMLSSLWYAYGVCNHGYLYFLTFL